MKNEAYNAMQPASDKEPFPRKARISTKMRSVIALMADEGIGLKQAANTIGMHYVAAQRAFRQNHVKIAYKQHVAAIRDNAAQNAYLRINKISQAAKSETVKLDANKWVAGVDGISPVTKTANMHHHQVTFGGFDYSGNEPEPDKASSALDTQPTDNADLKT